MVAISKTTNQIKDRFPKGIDKLEYGSGENPENGYIHLDIQPNLPHLDILANVRKLPIPSNFVQEIRAVHIMEHFCHPQFSSLDMRKKYGTTFEVLKEAYRILKKGGKFKIVTPDFEKISVSASKKRVRVDFLQKWVVGGHENEYDVHHWIWTHNDAIEWFTEAGFKNLSNWNPIQGKRAWKLKWLLNLKKIYQPPHPLWYDVEWYHWLFFEGTKL